MSSRDDVRAVNRGLKELAGIVLCENPRCHRLLKDGQGTTHADGKRTCFTPSCQDWARLVTS